MNIDNLKRMYNHMLTVPEERINMRRWREGIKKKKANFKQHECDSCGCVIGHCVILDEWKNIPTLWNGNIDFRRWSGVFIQINTFSSCWEFMFGSSWPNDKSQILARMKYVIENQEFPQEWLKLTQEHEYKITDPQYLKNTPYQIP